MQVCRHLYFKLEKKEIIDAFIAGYELNNSINMSEQLAEHYYNSIYNPNSFEKTEERGAFFIFCPNTHKLSSERLTPLAYNGVAAMRGFGFKNHVFINKV